MELTDEPIQLKVSADQIDSAVSWVEANKVNIIKKLETLDTEVLQLSEDVLLIKGLDLQHMQNDVDDLKSSLSTLDAEVMQLTEDVLLIKGLDLQHMKSDIEDLQANTYTKTETDAKITEKVSALVAGAPERFDTLKELADWIDSHADSAAAMNSAIEKNETDISTANTNITKNAADISAANTAIEKNETDIATANENIQKNVDSIATVNENIAINKSTLGIQCKNLLKPTTISQGETKGITITVNDDGTITATGTATETFAINVGMVALKAGNYILNGCPSGGSNTTYRLDTFYDAASHHRDLGNSVKVNLSSDTNVVVRLVIYPAAGEVNLTFAPMIVYADVLGRTYEPYQADVNTRISALETLSDAVYKYHKSSYCTIDGYVLRVGNQVHLNLTATFHTACGEWYGGVINLPFNTKTPDNSTRYTIKQTQSDGRETSIYLQMGGTSFYSSTTFKKGDIITIPPMILNMYVEEATTTEGGE